MAGRPSVVKEELKMSIFEDLGTGNIEQSQEQTMPGENPLKCLLTIVNHGHQVQVPLMPRDQSQGDAHLQEFPGNFQGGRFPYECLEADIVAEISLEQLNGLEMEVMRRQIQVISGRLHALEDQNATWHHKETVLFSLLMPVFIANLWLWMRQ
ncbi:LOW QUALITY PROTEIN: fetal and adult testis-expressed transcript protein [Onychomys torridus]|uniref:LOW QUALITY PROTEIN: fetal and adult testis-expressed transcript protein n=1 Tax=Onychomys torridus TaxID=38674 RepID=UPI00167F9065|nr:LOW QUALITY PROTEIN: fetal and adult testis-expressed transcript protein [Onychomys torridus]